jgi:hypothetical protein
MTIRSLGYALLLLSALGFLAACGSDDGPTAQSPGQGSINATINGSAWAVSTPFTSAQNNVGGAVFVITAADPNQTYGLAISLSEFAGAGTYEIRPGFPLRMAVVTLGTEQGWGTQYSEVPGTITITSLTDSRVTGTFSFTAEPSPSSSQTETLTVVNGQFDIPVIEVG